MCNIQRYWLEYNPRYLHRSNQATDWFALNLASLWSFSRLKLKLIVFFAILRSIMPTLTSNGCNLSHHGSERRHPIRHARRFGFWSQTSDNDSCFDLPPEGVFWSWIVYVVSHSSTNVSISGNGCWGCRYRQSILDDVSGWESLRNSRTTCSTRCSKTVQSLPPLNEINIWSIRYRLKASRSICVIRNDFIKLTINYIKKRESEYHTSRLNRSLSSNVGFPLTTVSPDGSTIFVVFKRTIPKWCYSIF